MSFDAHNGTQNFATAGPQALVHHLHGVLGGKEALVAGVWESLSPSSHCLRTSAGCHCLLDPKEKTPGKGLPENVETCMRVLEK